MTVRLLTVGLMSVALFACRQQSTRTAAGMPPSKPPSSAATPIAESPSKTSLAASARVNPQSSNERAEIAGPARARRPLAFSAVAIAAAGTPLERNFSNPTYQLRQVTLRQMIELAYGVTWARTSGGPAWMDSLNWQVVAKASDASASYKEIREILRTMLAERFELKAAFVTMPVSSVLLSFEHANREGVRPAHVKIDCQPFLNGLKPPTAVPHTSEGWPMCGPTMMEHSFTRPVNHYRSAPLDRVALDLEKELRQVVLVSPPRPGLFDVDFTWPPGYNTTTPDRDVDAFLSALHDQLGIEALIKPMPVQVLQIESAAQPRPGAQ